MTPFNISRKAALLAAAATFASLSGGGMAWAQAAPGDAADQLDEVVVTATRREQRLQDVPLSVTAVSGETLAKSNFREVTDIQYLAPNVSFSSTNPVANGGGYQIRGIGTQTYDGSVEQTVGLVIDGVVIGLPRDPGLTGFADIERVEVLRGPQGTLFGKNASAGVIQIITKDPRLEEFSGNLNLSYGERNEIMARGSVNLPLGSTAAARISAYSTSQDGAIPFIMHGDHVGDRENSGVRGKFLWSPTDDLSFILSADYQKGFARDVPLIEKLGTNANYNALFSQFSITPGQDTYVSFSDGDWTADTTVKGVSLQARYNFAGFVLTSISAYRESSLEQYADIDQAPIDIFNYSDTFADNNQFTQEFRLESPTDGRLDYVLGLYYYKTNLDSLTVQKGDFLKFITGISAYPPAVIYGARSQHNETESYAAYGQATYALTDKIDLIGGLRYTNDSTSGALSISSVDGYLTYASLTPYSGEVSADNVSGRIGLQYSFDRNLMTYVTYSTGYKGPAIDSLNGEVIEVRPETVESWEIGAKSTLLNGRVTLNGAIYAADYTDFQAQALDMIASPPRLSLTNAGLMRSRGAEFEAHARLFTGLTVGASASYNNAKYIEYTGACYTGQAVSSTAGTGCYLLSGTTSTYVANYAGERLANAPVWSYNFNVSYERPVGAGLQIDASANWSWRDDTYAQTSDPNSIIDAYGLLNANIGFGSEDGRWRLGLYARNLLDQMYYAATPSLSLFNSGGYDRLISPNAFRTVGMNLSIAF